MKSAYIVLTHNKPEQLFRLISRLDDEGVTFVIHVCVNATREDYRRIKEEYKTAQGVHFCKRENGAWSEFGIVQAVLNGMELLMEKRVDFDYVHVISGSDYPIKSNKFIRDFFEKHKGKQFLWCLPVHDEQQVDLPAGSIHGEDWKSGEHPWPQLNRYIRFEKYWFTVWGERLMVPEIRFIDKPLWNVLKIFLHDSPELWRKGKWKRELLLLLLSVTHRAKRSYPEGFSPYAGSQWFSVTKDCCAYILKTHREKPELKKYFKRTLLPDESYFTTILAHSPFKESIAQSNMRFIRWEGEDRSHPEVLTKADFPALQKSEKLFARKFDADKDAEILNLLDSEILKG